MSQTKQSRPDLNNQEISFFELLKSTISALDDINVAAFAGVIPIKKEDKGSLGVFTNENGELKLRSFPLSNADAKEIYQSGEVNTENGNENGKYGKVLSVAKFGFTGQPVIPSWILSRITTHYSHPVEHRPDGLYALGAGESITLPNDKSTEFDEENSYIDPSSNVKYYMTVDINERAGTLLIGLPTSYEGGEMVVSKPQSTQDGKILSTSINWSKISSPTDEKWEIQYCYFQPPSKITISEVTKGTMLFLQYFIWTNDDAEYLKSVDVDDHSGMEAIKERLMNLINDKDVLNSGGKVGFGLQGYYENWGGDEEEKDDEEKDDDEDKKDDGEDIENAEESEEVKSNEEAKEDKQESEGLTSNDESVGKLTKEVESKVDEEVQEKEKTPEELKEEIFKRYQPKEPRTITPEEEIKYKEEFLTKLKGADKYLLVAIKELELNWYLEAVYMPMDEDEFEEDKEVVEGEEHKAGGDKGEDDYSDKVEESDGKMEKKQDEEKKVDSGDDGANEDAEEVEKLEDPTKAEDIWTSSSAYAIQGQTFKNSNQVRKALLEKGVKHNENIYWINTPMYYENQCWYKDEENGEREDDEENTLRWRTLVYNWVQVGFAIMVELPAK